MFTRSEPAFESLPLKFTWKRTKSSDGNTATFPFFYAFFPMAKTGAQIHSEVGKRFTRGVVRTHILMAPSARRVIRTPGFSGDGQKGEI